MSLLKAYFNDNELLYDLDMVYPEFISTVRALDTHTFNRYAFNKKLLQRASNESVFLVTTTSNKDDSDYIKYLQSKCPNVKGIQVLNWMRVSPMKIEIQLRNFRDRPDYVGLISCEANSYNLKPCFEQHALVAWPNYNLTSSVMDERATGRSLAIFSSSSHKNFDMIYEGGNIGITGSMFNASIDPNLYFVVHFTRPSTSSTTERLAGNLKLAAFCQHYDDLPELKHVCCLKLILNIYNRLINHQSFSSKEAALLTVLARFGLRPLNNNNGLVMNNIRQPDVQIWLKISKTKY